MDGHGAEFIEQEFRAVRERVSEFVFLRRHRSMKWTHEIRQVGKGWHPSRPPRHGEEESGIKIW